MEKMKRIVRSRMGPRKRASRAWGRTQQERTEAMKKWNRVGTGAVVAVMIAMSLGGRLSAGELEITEFRNGYITFSNENPSLYYRIEFKPNLTDAVDWDGSFKGLRNITSSDAEVTVPVGVFYRVVGSETPWVAGTASASDLLSGKTAYVDDEQITGTMPNVGQTNIIPGTVTQAILQGYHDGTGSVDGDASLVAGNIKKGATIFGVTGTYEGGSGDTYEAGVPKTGQTSSYRTGDDGTHRMGVAWPSPRFIDHGNGTVTDRLTGLMWVKAPQSLDGNDEAQSWNDAIDFCNDLNFAEYSDWRLPNVRELLSLIDYGNFSPALPTGHPFTNVQNNWYWSSSTYADSTGAAWIVLLYSGSVLVGSKTDALRVWPVRSGQ